MFRGFVRSRSLWPGAFLALLALFATWGTVSAAGGTGSVSGTVRDAATSPVEGAVVFINDFASGAAAGNTVTASDGTYTLSDLGTGDYRVQVNASELGFPVQYYDGVQDAESAAGVAVVDGVDTGGIDFTLPTAGTISGTVYEADGTTPVPDANVWAEPYTCCGSGSGATTDVNGDFTIAGLAPDDYRVQAEAGGFAREYYQETASHDAADPVTVSAGTDASGTDFTLAAGGTVTGTVYEADGVTPVEGANVWADNYECCGGGNGAVTDASGSYSITGLGSGEYRVQAEAAGLAREYYQEAARFRLASSVAVTEGAATSGIDFTLAAAGSISGTVYEADGTTPVVGARVWANSYVCCGGGNGAQSSADGTYTITGLAPGDYRVQAEAEDQSLAREFYDDTNDWGLATSVTVTAGATQAGIDFDLAQGGSISGTVFEVGGATPVADADVWAESYVCCGRGNGTRTAADGTYTITGLAAGEYRVQAQAESQSLAREYYNDTADWSLATSVTVAAGATQTGIDFTLPAGGAISGTVYEADGTTPLADADVWADTYTCCGGGNGTRSAADGTYTIPGLAPGDYRVQSRAPGQGRAGEFYDDTSDWNLATAVTVTAGATQAGIDFTLAEGGSIAGTVYEADGTTPVANAHVWADTYECCGGGNGTRTGPDGTYTIRGLASGTYRVRAEAEAGGLAAEFYDGTADWNLATPVIVTAGSTQASIDFTLAQGGSISGTVYEADGTTPVANADVWADSFVCCSGGNGARSGADGTYTITGLTAGDYRVQAQAESQSLANEVYDETNWQLATPVTVTAGATQAGIDFTLAAGGSISGTVYEADGTTPVANADVWADSYVCCAGGNGTRTGADGTYTITGLAPGDYRVQSRADARGLSQEIYSETTAWHLATPVTVAAGATAAGIDFTLAAGGSIAGTVYEADGTTPVANADVWADTYVCCGGGNGTRTAADGSYTITGLPPGDYRVQARAEAQALAGELYDDTTDRNLATPVVVTAGATQGGIDFTLAVGGSISGTVYESDGTTPVANADVWADSYSCCGGGNGTRSGADGTYTVSGLAPGDYRVQAQAEAQGLTREFYDETGDWSIATPVTVAGGATQAGIDFTLGAGGSISGTVYESDGTTPVANADVWADTYACCGGGNGTRSGADGTYTITGLAPGDYRVQARAEAEGLTHEFYDDTGDWNLATPVSVTAGATQAEIDFTLAAGGSIAGTVYEADGTTPIAGANVRAESYVCCGGGDGIRTAADGTYTLTGLAPGDYRVRARAGARGFSREFYNETSEWDLAAAVAVTAGTTTSEVDFTLAAGGSISGTVYETDGTTPVANADVWADAYVCCGGGNGTRSGADGTYTIRGLVAGEYRVQARGESQGLAGEFYDDTSDWNLAASVAVTAGATQAGIDFTLAAGGSISGTVYEADGTTPVANADVWADSYECCGNGNGTRSAADGTYTITGLAPGEYRVQAQAEALGLVREFYDGTTDWSLASSVAVSAGATQAGIDFTLAVGGSISGTVYEADGTTPVANADVWADAYVCCGGGNGTRSGADGTYAITGLAPGEYRVQAQKESQSLAREFYDDTSDWNLATSVAVTAGATQAGIDFTLAAGGSISGTIYEADGTTPVANTDVWADSYECCGNGNGTRSAADGTYTISGLAPGDYRVQAQKESQGLVRQYYNGTGAWHLATSVSVTAGATQSGIDFTLAAGGSISGTVFEADGTTPVPNADVWADSYVCCGGGNGARTAADGTYAILGLAPGEYRVQAEARDLSLVREFYDETGDWGLATSVVVTAGATQAGIDFTLVAGGSISGTVYQADGTTPAGDVDVWADTYVCCSGGNGTRSAADGTYTITGLASGDYRVQAESRDQDLAREFYDDAAFFELAAPVTVTAGATQPGIDFTLEQAGAISGTVTDAVTGDGIANFQVNVDLVDSSGNREGRSRTETDADGNYTIGGLVPGDYKIRARRPVGAGDVYYIAQFYDGEQIFDDATVVVVSAGTTIPDVDLALVKGGAVSGTVTDGATGLGIPNMRIRASLLDAGGNEIGGSGARTDDEGNYLITGMPPGGYKLQACCQRGGDVYAVEYYQDRFNFDTADVVVISVEVTTEVDFALDVGGTISGNVYLADGTTPVANLHVFAEDFDTGEWMSGTNTDATGAYTLVLPTGSYRVRACAECSEEAGGLVDEFWQEASAHGDATAVAVTAPNDTSSIDFTLASGGTISGHVYLADGTTPVDDLHVFAEDFDTGEWKAGANTDADGSYTLVLLTGSYRVRACAACSEETGGLVDEFWQEASAHGDATAVAVTAPNDTPNIDFTLASGGTISGTVTDAVTGEGIANFQINVDRVDSSGNSEGRSRTETDADGNYSIGGLVPGDYKIRARRSADGSGPYYIAQFYSGAEFFDDAQIVVVPAGVTVPGIDFALEKGGAISGTVTDQATGLGIANMRVNAILLDAGGGEVGRQGARTDADGNYIVTGLLPGDYKLQACCQRGGDVYVAEYYQDRLTFDTADVVVISVEVTTDVDFALEVGGTISGQVYLADGTTPVANLHVFAVDFATGEWVAGDNTDADGAYKLVLPTGSYRVRACAACSEEAGGLLDEYWQEASASGDATAVAVTAPDDTPNIDFTLDSS